MVKSSKNVVRKWRLLYWVMVTSALFKKNITMPGTGFKVPETRLAPPSQLELSLDDAKFCSYHTQNPHIYKAFKALTLQTIRKGFKNFGAKSIFELLRWKTGVAADGDVFKINNNYTPLYARMFEKEYPEHKDFFRKRGSKFD